MLSVGDAVLTFLGDTSQLDQVFAKIPDQAATSMSAAADSVNKVGDALKGVEYELDYTGANAAYAGGEISDGMGKAKKAVDDLGYSFRGARGAIALTAEEFGVHLPRELAILLAHIPLIGAAFETMLPIIGVVAAIAVIGTLIEKHEQLEQAIRHDSEVSETLSIKQQDLALGLKAANLQLEDQIKQLEGRPATNQLQIALINVKTSLDELTSSYATDFAKMDKPLEEQMGLWQRLQDDVLAAGASFRYLAAVQTLGISEFAEWGKSTQQQVAANYALQESLKNVAAAEDKLNEARRKLADIDPQKDLGGWKLAAGELATAAGRLQSSADSAHEAVKKIKPDAHELLASLTDRSIEARGEWQALDEKIKAAGLDIKKVHQEMANDAAERAAGEAKRAMDQQIASIEAFRSAQHAAYETGKIDAAAWQLAEVSAADAAAIAHEDYLKKLISLYTRAGEAEKAQIAQEQLAALQTKNMADAVERDAEAMQKRALAIRHNREEYDALIATNVDKEFEKTQKASEALTHATEDLTKADAKLAETKVAAKYRDEESAIRQLAQMRLITEQQMNDRLALLERKQAGEAVAILEAQLKKEQADIAAAQAKLASQKNSPFVSQAQILEAETNLKKLQAAVDATETQIVQAEEKYNKQSEADTKSHYGRALLAAMAYGRDLLAEQLKENRASLIATENELNQAKARGINTAAIEKQIAIYKTREQQLEKEASGNKALIVEENKVTQAKLSAANSTLLLAKAQGLDTTAVETYIAKLKLLDAEQRKELQELPQLSGAMVQLRNSTEQTAQTMERSFATATAAMVSGQESFGKAMEKATLQMLSQLAQHWADYFIALAIGNIWTDPAAAAEEFAAAAALEVIAGAMSGLGSSSSSGAGAGGSMPGQNQAGLNPQQAGSAGGGGQQTQGITRLATGGIVSSPTMFMAGDSPSGGDADEAILPLSDPEAMRRVAQSIIGSIIPISQERSKEAAMVSNASAVSAIPTDEFGVPSVRERPDFNFSETPIPRETPDVQALAARFGGLLSVPTLRAATAASNQAARASAEHAASSGSFDNASFENFADRVGQHVAAGQGPTTAKDSGIGDNHIHVNVKGMISPDNLNKVIKKINRSVQNRQVTLNASNSLRLTRRSP